MALTIGQVARAAEVNVETVRFYERKGLIEQPEAPSRGFRQYPSGIVQRIRFIKRAQLLGFTLTEVEELLRMSAQGACDDVRAQAEKKLLDVEEKIRDLERVKIALLGLLKPCRARGLLDPCPILAALDDEQHDNGETA